MAKNANSFRCCLRDYNICSKGKIDSSREGEEALEEETAEKIEKPELETGEGKPEEKWQPSPEIRLAAEECVAGFFPLELRPSPAKIEEFYQIACNLYKSGKYKEALPFFELLGVSNAKDYRYLIAIAACYHMLKSYKDAAPAYTIASVLDPDNPYPQYHLADCFIRMHEPVGAYVALEMAITRCKKNPRKYKGLMDRVNAILNKLKKEFEAKAAQGITNFREGAPLPDISNLPPF